VFTNQASWRLVGNSEVGTTSISNSVCELWAGFLGRSDSEKEHSD
jgi:hypothetical protein